MASWGSSFLKLSSYIHPCLQSSKTLSGYLSSRHPTLLLSLFIASASNRWPNDLSTPTPHPPTPPCNLSPTFLAPLACALHFDEGDQCLPYPLSLASGVIKTTCMSFLKGGCHCQTGSSLAGGEGKQTVPTSPICVRDNVKTPTSTVRSLRRGVLSPPGDNSNEVELGVFGGLPLFEHHILGREGFGNP